MDYSKELSELISFQKGSNNNETMEMTINKTMSFLSEDDKNAVEKLWKDWNVDNEVSEWKYILLTIFIVENVKRINDKDDTFSVKLMQKLKISMELITLLGLKPNCPLYDKSSTENRQTDALQRYDRLIFVMQFFVSCFDDFLMKTCVLPYLGPILTALIYMAHVDFATFNLEQATNNDSTNLFSEAYSKVKTTKAEFKVKLVETMQKCSKTLIMKELMVIHGTEGYPKFMRIPARSYLVEHLIQPNGVISLICTICNEEDLTNVTNHWDKLEVAAKLIAVSQGNDKELYYTSVYNQLIDVLKIKKFAQGASVVRCCIKALYKHNADICMNKFIKVIAAPFVNSETKVPEKSILWNEDEVTSSIELLAACFLTDEAEFKQLPMKMLIPLSLPILCLYVKSVNSISALRQTIKQLALKVLSLESIREELFGLFLNLESKCSHDYGRKINFQLGDSGNFQITETCEEIDQEELTNALLELVNQDKIIAFELFNFLLKSLPSFKFTSSNALETNWDIIDRMTKQLSLVNLLIQLANLSIVQKRNMEKPEHLLTFVKSLITSQKYVDKTESVNDEDQMNVGYIGLMLVKVMLDEIKQCRNWAPFEDFVSFLNVDDNTKEMSSSSKKLIDEIKSSIKGKSQKKTYEDLSVIKEKSEFEKAREDLADPLIPVQAHGLITMTRLIEKGDPETLENKDVLICILQLNLRHEDSFIYLAAVNGLCALTLRYPKSVIEILIQEFIHMPQRSIKYDISAENRAKIGEILVKATRNLGEMASVHKTTLINGFLCAIRDSDPLVRASSLSCLGELCKILGFRLGSVVEEVIYCIGCIIKTDKEPECRRAAVLVITLLLRGLGKEVLIGVNSRHLLDVYRSLKYLRDNDSDDVIRLHAQLGLEEIDDIVKNELLIKPKLEKRLFLVSN